MTNSLFRTVSVVVMVLSAGVGAFGQGEGRVRGVVKDPNGAVIVGVKVTAVNAAGEAVKAGITSDAGEYNLAMNSGEYTLRFEFAGFRVLNEKIAVSAGSLSTYSPTLEVGIHITTVTIDRPPPINTDPDNNASAIVLGKEQMKALPDDPAELEAALRALAGPGSGPEGGEIFIDGFSGGRLPKKETIREVRINQNPFSSEYDRPGFGRIEILTRPGSEEWSGEFGIEFEDESLNSRNPFAVNRPPYQLRNFSGDLSGPLIKNRLSFYTDIEHERIANNLLVNALVLNQSLVPEQFQRAFTTKSTNFDMGHRVDFQITQNHTLVARYSRETFSSPHTAFGGFELPSTGWASSNREWFIRLTETAVLSPTVVNETRFQFFKINEEQDAVAGGPSVRVLDAFTSGGSIGNVINRQGRHELANITSIVYGNHLIRTGVRIRKFSVDDISPGNFQGTFTFTTLDQYRNTILNVPGAMPTQLSIAGGEPRARVTRWDWGAFVQDDYKWRPNVTLSFGLRYERQNLISSSYDLAPRFAVAWAPSDGKNAPKTVIRAGFGMFYDRFSQSQGLNIVRFNGVNRQQFIVTDPAILDAIVFTQNGVTNIPSVATLAAFQQPQLTRVADPNLRSPYNMQTAISVERQLPFKTTVSVSYINSQIRRMLRSRNINAPVNGIRPNPAADNIYQYESTGRLRQNQIVVNFRSNASERFSLFGNYSLGFAKSDTDGAGTFPANQFDLTGEYGRWSQDVRHRFSMGSNFSAPWGLEFSPFITFRTGAPFNITAGTDVNEDTLFNDRPAFGVASEPGVIVTRFGTFDPTPEPGDVIIPRNYGRGHKYIQENLRISKTFHFARHEKGDDDDDEENEGKYRLELELQIRNIFNRVNRGTPVSNLRSPLFGQSLSGGGGAVGNRRIMLEAVFSF